MSAEGLPRRVNVLRVHRAFRRFWVARTVSHVGDGAAVVALVLYVKAAGGTGTTVGALLLAQSLPHLLAPFAGVLADRVDRRSIMIGCDLSQAALFGSLGWWHAALVPLLSIVAITSLLDTTFGPAGQSAVPGLVPVEDLVEANAWTATSLNLQVALGPVLGGVLVAAFGTRWALTANALSFVISAALLAGLAPMPATGSKEHRGVVADSLEGIRATWQNRLVRAVLLILFFGVMFAAIGNVALVFLVRDVLGAGPAAFGVASGVFGIGMVVGSLAIAMRARRMSSIRLMLLAWLLSAIGPLLTALTPSLAVVLGAQAVAGAGNGIDLVASATIVQREIPTRLLGRVFGMVSVAAFAGSSAAFLLGGILLDATSPRVAFLVAGCGVLAVWLVATVVLRGFGKDAGARS